MFPFALRDEWREPSAEFADDKITRGCRRVGAGTCARMSPHAAETCPDPLSDNGGCYRMCPPLFPLTKGIPGFKAELEFRLLFGADLNLLLEWFCAAMV